MKKMFDTCALLDAVEQGCELKDFYISSITLEEIEHIKTSNYKDEHTKFQARKASLFLKKNVDIYNVILYTTTIDNILQERNLPLTNDNKIIASCGSEMEFITNDLNAALIARNIFGLQVRSLAKTDEQYTGYIELHPTDAQLNELYSSDCSHNIFNALVNQYVILYNEANEVIDTLCWTGTKYRKLKFKPFDSKWFGQVKAKKGDVYQQCACDALLHSQITCIQGPAASGKSYLALGYLMSLLEAEEIDKIVIYVNPVPVRGAGTLGWYKGTKNEKLLDSQIGNFLISKIGGIEEVERLIETDKIILLPISDCRGFDTTEMRAGVYMTEAQNMSVDLMKLIIQRTGEDSIVIIEGDSCGQIDSVLYSGLNNGMRRMSKVFRDKECYAEVWLKNIYRSEIAKIAEAM